LLAVTTILAVLIVKKSKWSFLLIVLMLLSWKSVFSTFGWNYLSRETQMHSEDQGLRVLSWNVFRWDQMNIGGKPSESHRESMLREILMENADVMCFHEFFEPAGIALKKYQPNIEAIRARGYRYYVFFPTSIIQGRSKYFGMAIFSKYPIVDSAMFNFGKTPHSEGLMYADIKVKEKTIRVFTTHLESFKLGKSSYFGSQENGGFSNARSSILSIKNAYRHRHDQMNMVNEKISLSPYPVLLLGNFGDVPNSQTYTVLGKNLNDAFLSNGWGLGTTFRNVLPTLRLDYILVDKKININKFQVLHYRYSDHYPLMADLSFQ
jgi:endonuclease/exonuclease/phosphatase family metal-dependent hydrolase